MIYCASTYLIGYLARLIGRVLWILTSWAYCEAKYLSDLRLQKLFDIAIWRGRRACAADGMSPESNIQFDGAWYAPDRKQGERLEGGAPRRGRRCAPFPCGSAVNATHSGDRGRRRAPFPWGSAVNAAHFGDSGRRCAP